MPEALCFDPGSQRGDPSMRFTADQVTALQALVSGAWVSSEQATHLDAIGWPQSQWPLSISVDSRDPLYPRGSAGLTLRQALAIAHPTWESWQTFWVDAGAGSNGTGTEASPFNGYFLAVVEANATGNPAIIRCKGGATAPRTKNFSNGGATLPTVDLVFIAYSGRSVVGSHGPLTWTADGTYAWCYTVARSSAATVVDLTQRSAAGTYQRLTKVASAAICSRTPNSWWTDNVNVLVNRADGAAATDANTRVYLSVGNFAQQSSTQYTAVLLAETSADGFDLEGGGAAGAFTIAYTANTGSRTVVVGAENCTFRYGGGLSLAVGNVVVNGVNGLALFDTCDASDGATDLFNFHQSYSATQYGLTVNCSGRLSGQNPSYTSCNPLTGHENHAHLDVCGRWLDARGCTVHFINTTKSLIVHPVLSSLGDVMNGGTFPPTELRVDNTASMRVIAPTFPAALSGRPRAVVADTATLGYRGLTASEIQVASGATAAAI